MGSCNCITTQSWRDFITMRLTAYAIRTTLFNRSAMHMTRKYTGPLTSTAKIMINPTTFLCQQLSVTLSPSLRTRIMLQGPKHYEHNCSQATAPHVHRLTQDSPHPIIYIDGTMRGTWEESPALSPGKLKYITNPLLTVSTERDADSLTSATYTELTQKATRPVPIVRDKECTHIVEMNGI